MGNLVCHVRVDIDEETREDWRQACKDLDYYGEHEGRQYCVLHFPGEDKKGDFSKALYEKLEDGADFFPGVYFPGNQSFEFHTFSAQANFSNAIFRGDVDFYKAFFEGEVSFDEATFHGEANFVEVTFEGTANFFGTIFEGSALFWRARFNGDAYFVGAKFLERAGFSALENYEAFDLEREVNFDYIEIEKPEQFEFRTLKLRARWLLYVGELEKVYFHNVIWADAKGPPRHRLTKEVEALERREIRSPRSPFRIWKRGIEIPYRLLGTKYDELLKNYEDKRDYSLASDFHYLSMEARRKHYRLEAEQQEQDRSRFGLIATLYGWLSGYGDKPRRAALVLAGICVAFAVFYMLLGPTELQNFWTALVYSMGALARLNPNPRPDPTTDSSLFQFLVIVEGIIGPLQIALLALAIRHKVMR